jgi:polysaccharide pyruvyl transferase WcaK-like protein
VPRLDRVGVLVWIRPYEEFGFNRLSRYKAVKVSENRQSFSVRILVEPSDYVLRNVGDMAMLRTAVLRLVQKWPGALIQVLSDTPDDLAAFCPEVTPLVSTGRQQWLRMIRGSERFPRVMRHLTPELIEFLWCRKLGRQNRAGLADLRGFINAVATADLIIVTGMGGITDAFPEYAANLLEVLALAVRSRRYVAMVGQGFGPLHNPKLVARARVVLPQIDFIGIREDRASLPLLLALGIASDRVMTTGDDAIEMAYRLRRNPLGEGLGVNVRIADYSGVDRTLLEALRSVLRDATQTRRVPMVPLPISRVPGESDIEAIQYLMDVRDDSLRDGSPLETLDAVVRQVQKCRVVITGSYHAGVFALANGIPTIGLAKSTYYIDKFMGLSALFSPGCETVLLEKRDFAQHLKDAIARFWNAAERFKPLLLANAARQIELGREAYDRIGAVVGSRIMRKAGSSID